jgi:hypothetical protein
VIAKVEWHPGEPPGQIASDYKTGVPPEARRIWCSSFHSAFANES